MYKYDNEPRSLILVPELGSNGMQSLIDLVKMLRILDIDDTHQFTQILVVLK